MLGGAYVNVKKNLAVGVNGIRIDHAKLDGRTLKIKAKGTMSELKQPWEKPYTTDLRIAGLTDGGSFNLVINDGEPLELSAKALSSVPIVVNPDGSVLAEENK